MTLREIMALLITMLALTILALVASILTGCATPPRKVTKYEARLRIELPDGKVVAADDWGYKEE